MFQLDKVYMGRVFTFGFSPMTNLEQFLCGDEFHTNLGGQIRLKYSNKFEGLVRPTLRSAIGCSCLAILVLLFTLCSFYPDSNT